MNQFFLSLSELAVLTVWVVDFSHVRVSLEKRRPIITWLDFYGNSSDALGNPIRCFGKGNEQYFLEFRKDTNFF